MGFGAKVDLATGRKLNLDASYQNLIKPTVEDAGLECVRADEIQHSGNINVPMYEQLLTADLVIADLSTSNNNAFYELGVRHALRPYTTIIIAEDQFNFPFDIAQIAVRKYKHLGDDIGVSEARRFCGELKEAIEEILAQPKDDSPVYIFLNRLRRLKLPDDMVIGDESEVRPGDAMRGLVKNLEAVPPPPAVSDVAADMTHSALMQQVAEAKKRGDFVTAKALLATVRMLMKGTNPDKPEDPYIIQQLALATYKSESPTTRKALEDARDLLVTLDPETSNDTETLGIWGAVHKRLCDLTGSLNHLNKAVRGYERGFYLRNDYYNGINLAYLLNVRVVLTLKRASDAGVAAADVALYRAEAVTDFVQAGRIRREVISICDDLLKKDEGAEEADKMPAQARYWVSATLAEAYVGVGDEANAQANLDKAAAVAVEDWMTETTREQISKLRGLLLRKSPLDYVKADGE